MTDQTIILAVLAVMTIAVIAVWVSFYRAAKQKAERHALAIDMAKRETLRAERYNATAYDRSIWQG